MLYFTIIVCIGPLHEVLRSVQHQVELESGMNCPVPITTKVVLQHMEIDIEHNNMLIFCQITGEDWLVQDMIQWKGYTLIAKIGISNGPRVGTYTFSGTGKIPILGKNVSILKLGKPFTNI